LSCSIEGAKIIVGSSDASESFSGYMASFRLYDKAVTADEVLQLTEETQPKKVAGPIVGINKVEKKTSNVNVFYRSQDENIIIQDLNNEPIGQIKLTSIDGRIIAAADYVKSSEFILHSPGTGIYLITISNKGDIFSKKIIVN
jgi:hypothetical protein